MRRLGALLIATPLATGITLVATPTTAHAASGEITSPANGAVITSGSQLTANATYKQVLLGGVQLRVSTPGGGDQLLASGGLLRGTVSGSFGIRKNGRYTVRLVRRSQTYDTNTVTVRIPPARPSGVSAKVSGRTLSVTWNLGPEADLSGYSVSASGLGSKSGSPGSLCSGSTCSSKFTLGKDDTGSSTVSIRSLRPDGTGGSVSSGAASDSVNLPDAPSGGGDGGGDNGGSGGGGNDGDNGALTPRDRDGQGGGTPLTPFNHDSPITLPSVQPDGATPGFAYPAPVVAEEDLGGAGPALADLQWGKSVALALVLLIVAAHLGTWTRRMRVAQTAVNSRGMAARIAMSGTGRTRVTRTRERIARAQSFAQLKSPATTPQAGTATRPSGPGTSSAAAPGPQSRSSTSPRSSAKPSFPGPAQRRSNGTEGSQRPHPKDRHTPARPQPRAD
ncbi:hypothetical protein [Thermomonospora umbrina]|nr:hypothetical protein [Thermomonospora umbrina]